MNIAESESEIGGVSAVIVSRNDNYGGNLRERATYCLQSAIDTFDEVIYVDWNSPGGSLLEDVRGELSFRGNLRHFVVPPDQAERWVPRETRGQLCCEVLGRNIGIRRATGEWVVSTNIDIIAPAREMFLEYLGSLDPTVFYPVSRRNVSLSAIRSFHGSDRLEYGEYERLRDHLIKEAIDPIPEHPPLEGDTYSLIDCCGDFQIARREVWHALRGFEERLTGALFADTSVQKKAHFLGYGLKAILDLPVFHIDHGKGGGGMHEGEGRLVNDREDAIFRQEASRNGEDWGMMREELTEVRC
ncbi:MAG: hypothetical protein AAF591_03330 [Verrucomicrobiota bacterium]